MLLDGKNPKNSSLRLLLVGIFSSLLLTLLLTLLVAGIYAWTHLSFSILPYLAFTINAISALIGAIITAKQANQSGWIYGALTALLFSGCIVTLGMMIDFHTTFQIQTAFRMILLGLIGALGGVIGVNLTKAK